MDDPGRALRSRLAVPVSLNLIRCPFDHLLGTLRRIGGVEIRIEAEPAPDLPVVTFVVEDMPLGATLRWACRQARCSWRVDDDGIVVAPGQMARLPAPPPDQAEEEWLADAQGTLQSNVSFNFPGCDIDYALQIVFKTSGLNVMLDRDADPATRVTFAASDEPLLHALECFRAAGLDFALVDHALFVGSPEAVREVAGDRRVPSMGEEEDVF